MKLKTLMTNEIWYSIGEDKGLILLCNTENIYIHTNMYVQHGIGGKIQKDYDGSNQKK